MGVRSLVRTSRDVIKQAKSGDSYPTPYLNSDLDSKAKFIILLISIPTHVYYIQSSRSLSGRTVSIFDRMSGYAKNIIP